MVWNADVQSSSQVRAELPSWKLGGLGSLAPPSSGNLKHLGMQTRHRGHVRMHVAHAGICEMYSWLNRHLGLGRQSSLPNEGKGCFGILGVGSSG